jgi:WD40 repeat protein
LLALASFDDKVTILDAATKRVLKRLNGFFKLPNSQTLAFSHDGKLLAVAEKRAVNLWRTNDWQSSRRLLGESVAGDVIAMIFSPDPDDQTLTTASNGKLKFWDVTTDREQAPAHDLPPAPDYGYRLAYSADGKTLAVASHDEIQLWDAKSRSRIRNFTGKLDHIMSLAWSSHWLAAGSWSGDVKIWDLETGQECRERQSASDVRFRPRLSPDGKTLVTGGGDQKIHFWDVASIKSRAAGQIAEPQESTPRKVGMLQGHLHEVWAMAFSPDGQTLVSGSKDGTARFWSGIPKADETGLAEARLALRFSDDGNSLLTMNKDGTLSDWDIRSRPKPRVIDLGLAYEPGRASHCFFQGQDVGSGRDERCSEIMES